MLWNYKYGQKTFVEKTVIGLCLRINEDINLLFVDKRPKPNVAKQWQARGSIKGGKEVLLKKERFIFRTYKFGGGFIFQSNYYKL